MNPIRVKYSDYFFIETLKWTLAAVSVLIAIYSYFYGAPTWVVITPAALTVIGFSTGYVITIDPKQKKITERYRILWVPVRIKKIRYRKNHGIILQKERHHYSANSRGRTAVTDYFEYYAQLIYDKNQRYELKRSVDYEKFAAEIEQIASDLRLDTEWIR